MKTILLLPGSHEARQDVRPIVTAPDRYAVVESPASGSSFLECLRLDPDVIVMCAVEDIASIRHHTRSPILAVKLCDPDQQLQALRFGADDYASDIGEIPVKITALLGTSRRRRPVSASGIRLDPRTYCVSKREGSVHLTTNEFAVLDQLMRSAGRVVPRQILLRDSLKSIGPNSARALEVHVSRLRKKLGVTPDLIRSVRGTGYVFVDCENEQVGGRV